VKLESAENSEQLIFSDENLPMVQYIPKNQMWISEYYQTMKVYFLVETFQQEKTKLQQQIKADVQVAGKEIGFTPCCMQITRSTRPGNYVGLYKMPHNLFKYMQQSMAAIH